MELETEDWGDVSVAPVSQGTWRVAATGVATRLFKILAGMDFPKSRKIAGWAWARTSRTHTSGSESCR